MDVRNERIRTVWQELAPELAQHGFELVEVELDNYAGRKVLRLFIDKTGGVTLDDCTRVSHLLSPLLDLKDWFDGPYALEVSSPGIDRPIRKPEDFVRFMGEPVKLKTHEPVSGKKRFTGVLTGFQDGLVQVTCDETLYEVHLGNIKKANLDR